MPLIPFSGEIDSASLPTGTPGPAGPAGPQGIPGPAGPAGSGSGSSGGDKTKNFDVNELHVYGRIINYFDSTLVNGKPKKAYTEVQWADLGIIDPTTGKAKVFGQWVIHTLNIDGVPHYHATLYTEEPTEPNGRKHHFGVAWPISGVGRTRIFFDSADVVDEVNMATQHHTDHYQIGEDDGAYYKVAVVGGKVVATKQNPPSGLGGT
jgi:hypothetical protein